MFRKIKREFNKCGYDLVVITKENKKYNIEIKGLKDINNQFILSKNEYEKSDSDIYLICLVQNCKSLSSKVKIDFFKFVSGKWITENLIMENWRKLAQKKFHLNHFNIQVRLNNYKVFLEYVQKIPPYAFPCANYFEKKMGN